MAEEATILRLEDRREYDRDVADAWATSTDPARRARIALALGRIGTASFDDTNGDGRRDAEETMAGVRELTALASDSAPEVRRAAAFALGEIGDAASIDTLFSLASDSDAGVAANAAEALSKISSRVPFDRYQALVSTEHPPAVRAVAVRYLFRFGTDEASATAAMLLESVDPAIRLEATYALARRAFAPARRKLESLLRDEQYLVRAYAARALGAIGSAESLRALSEALDDPHAWVRTNAARAVGQVVGKNEASRSSELATATARQLVTLTTDTDPGVRATAVESLGSFATTHEAAERRLTELLGGDDAWLRETAALALAGAGRVSADSPIVGDPSPWVRARIVEGTAELPTGAAIRARLANSPEALVRSAVLGAIPATAPDNETRMIVAALQDDDVVVRAIALGRLAEEPLRALVSVERLRAIFEASWNETMNDARVAAVETLASREFEGRSAWLASLLTTPDPVVRRIAAEKLEQLDGSRPQYTPLPVDLPLSQYEEIARWAAAPRHATIRTARGDIRIELLVADAPMTAWNFATLAGRGYFDGTSFMRVVPNFVAQGGDPRNDMSGGPGYAIRDEINERRYDRGAVGMALSGADTGGSQFFITHSPQPHLDGGYTVFGRVTGGMDDVVDSLERGDRVTSIRVDGR